MMNENNQFLIDFEPDFKAWTIKEKCWFDTYFESQAAHYDAGTFRLHPFTGLLDKNGKKIYHGDILNLDTDYAKIIDSERLHLLVGFNNGSFMCGRDSNPYYLNTYLFVVSEHSEVVGNIYEHRDLLDIDLELADIVRNEDRTIRNAQELVEKLIGTKK